MHITRQSTLPRSVLPKSTGARADWSRVVAALFDSAGSPSCWRTSLLTRLATDSPRCWLTSLVIHVAIRNCCWASLTVALRMFWRRHRLNHHSGHSSGGSGTSPQNEGHQLQMALTQPQIQSLEKVLKESRVRGFLGPGPVTTHIGNALGFEPAIRGSSSVLDLGSGGGVPGLVLAEALPETRFTLLDASSRRCEFLEWAVEQLGMSARVDVMNGRAEELAHHEALRHNFDAVVARSFGRPAVLAECAVGFLRPGGRIVVSEPPAGDIDEERWPTPGLSLLGLSIGEAIRSDFGTVQVLIATRVCDSRYPRRTGIPGKRPLF